MSVQYPNFKINPEMVPNRNWVGDILSNAFQGYQMTQAPKKMQQEQQLRELQKQYLANQVKFQPQQVQSELDERAMRMKYYPQEMESELGLRNAQAREANIGAQQKQMDYDLIQSVLGGGYPQSERNKLQPQEQPKGMLKQGYLTPDQVQDAQEKLQAQQQQPIAQAGVGYGTEPQTQQDWIRQAYLESIVPGLKNAYPKPKYLLGQDGEVITIKTDLHGNAVGMSAQQVGKSPFERGLQAIDLAQIADNTKKYQALMDQGRQLEQMKNSIEIPELKGSTGPVSQYLSKAGAASKAAKDAYGEFIADAGELVTTTVAAMGGRAPATSINLVGSYKPSTDDPFEVTIGKVKGLMISQRNASQQMDKELTYERQGMPSNEAIAKAAKEVDWAKNDKDVRHAVDMGQKAAELKSKGMKIIHDDENFYVYTVDPKTKEEGWMIVDDYKGR